jgi:calcineurin-like phosphoesterase family protein
MFARSCQEVNEYVSKLNGQIYLIRGNHDNMKYIKTAKFGWIDKLKTIKINDNPIVLCHFAMKVWDKSHYGSIHLYGHSHGILPDDPKSQSMDVGVDANGFTPINYDTILEIMKKKKCQNPT